MSNKINRFKNRQQIKQSLSKKSNERNADDGLVEKFLESEIDKNFVHSTNKAIDDKYNFSFTDIKTNDKEISVIINEITGNYNKERLNLLVADCRRTVQENIVGPFGIGSYIVSKYDKKGGNVDTIFNVRKDIYVNEDEKLKSEKNSKYDSYYYHSHKVYKEKNRIGKQKKINSSLQNEYTDEIFKPNEKSNLDHTISANEIHLDKGRILADLDGPDLANSDKNLNFTSETINKSKKDKSIENYNKFITENRLKIKTDIKKLKQKKVLTKEEQKKLSNLEEKYKYNNTRATKKDAEARKEYEKKLNNQYYQSKKFINSSMKTSAAEGLKFGLQQSIGIMLHEFSVAVFDEIFDIYHNGFKGKNELNKTFFIKLKERLLNISNKVISKWDVVVKEFQNGFFSGFFSNIITILINTFKTTSKRVVRVIREGFFSLLKALKLLFSPPENMSLRQAAHESTKLIAGGLSITGGIFLEEIVEKSFASITFSQLITPVIVGILTGLGTTLVIYFIDKLDFFGVNNATKMDFINNELNDRTEKSIEEIDKILQSIRLISLDID